MLFKPTPKKFYSLSQLAGKASAGGGGYAPQGVRFNGTTTTFARSGLVGPPVNSVRGLMSFWFLLQGATDGTLQYFCTAESGGAFFFPRRTASHDILVSGRDASSNDVLTLDTIINNYTTSSMAGVWAHFLSSWDLSVPRGQIYINAVNAGSGPTITNTAINYNTTSWAIGGRPGASAISQMDLAEFFLDITQGPDISSSTLQQKFRDASGNAVDLGPTGSLPLGTQPLLCFTGGIAGWATNKGSGGNFTSAGTFANSPTSPP